MENKSLSNNSNSKIINEDLTINNLINDIYKLIIDLGVKVNKISDYDVTKFNNNFKSKKKKLKIIYSIIKNMNNIQTINILYNKQNYVNNLENSIKIEQNKRILNYSYHLLLKNKVKVQQNKINHLTDKYNKENKVDNIINKYKGYFKDFDKNLNEVKVENNKIYDKYTNLKANQKVISENLSNVKNLENKMYNLGQNFKDKIQKIISFYSTKMLIILKSTNKIKNLTNIIKKNKLDKISKLKNCNGIFKNISYLNENITHIEAFNHKFKYDNEIDNIIKNYNKNKENLKVKLYMKINKNNKFKIINKNKTNQKISINNQTVILDDNIKSLANLSTVLSKNYSMNKSILKIKK